MKAADTLDGDDFSLEEEARSGFKGVVGDTTGPPVHDFHEFDARAAARAADWLGVEAAIDGIFVFAAAVRAHGKSGHGGGGAIVGDVADDAETGAAVGAVYQAVAEATVSSGGHFTKAVGADGGIDGYAGVPVISGLGAGSDLEGRFAGDDFEVAPGAMIDSSEGGSIRGKQFEEGMDRFCSSLDLRTDPFAIVEDPAGDLCGQSAAVDEGAKADALNLTADEKSDPTPSGSFTFHEGR
jgi:hypothetical protein